MSRYRTTMAEALQKVYETPQGYALVQKAKEIAKKFSNNMTKAVAEIEKLEKGLSNNPTVDAELRKYNEQLEEKYTVVITKKDGTTMELGRYNTPAEAQRYVDQYGKGAKVKKEEADLEEGKMKDIFTADKEGESAEEISKRLKLPLATVKKILGEAATEIQEFTSDMIKRLKKSYSTMPQRISTAQADALSRHLDRLDLVSLKQLAKEKIPFITTLARNKIYKKTGKFEEYLSEEDHEISMARGELEAIIDKATKLSGALQGKSDNGNPLEAWVQSKITKAKDYINSVADYMMYTPDLGEEKEEPKKEDNKEGEIQSLKDQIAMLKTKLENEKNKAIKPEPNPETGEVPLTIGLAHKLLRDKEKKEVKEMAKDDAYAIGMAQAKKSMNDEPPLEKKTIKKGHKIAKKIMKNEEKRLYVEAIAGLQKKADKSGMPYSILKKVYDRGMAAWKGGHRPGASQHQWAFARVNSFVTKSSGTWGGADKDLAAKVRGSK